jgi:CubicO group peptidase (beta-lactamase class C family)
MVRFLACLLVVPCTVGAQVDAAAAARLRGVIDAAVANGEVAGTVTLVMQRGQVVFQHASGLADREAGRPMTGSTLFRIASQTKAITTTAAMILVEEGRLRLSDPVSRWIPSLAAATVSEPGDSSRPGRQLVRARRAITVRDLLTHTAGMSYGREPWLDSLYTARGLGAAAGAGWYFAHKTTDLCTAIEPLGELPLAAHPGERFVYGYGTDVLGCLVERISGQSLDSFVRERITAPLGMVDTRFCVAGSDRDRLAVVYARREETLTRAEDGPLGQGDYLDGPCRAFSGGAGMISTAPDYARFLEMLRQGGTLDGVRILSPASVTLMVRDHIDALYRGDEVGFGLGFEVYFDPPKAGRYGEPGRWGWGGAYHSNYWVDPAHEAVFVFMVQLLPATGVTVRDRFETLAYAMLPRLSGRE